MFLDETGFLTHPLRRRAWAPIGKPPVLTQDSHWSKITAIGSLTVSPQGRLGEQFVLQKQNVRWQDLVEYLCLLRRKLGRPLLVVWDRLPAHRTAAKLFQALGLRWVRFFWLPPASPDLNPVEGLWSDTKYADLANHVPADAADHWDQVQSSLCRVRRSQRLLRACFEGAGLKLPHLN